MVHNDLCTYDHLCEHSLCCNHLPPPFQFARVIDLPFILHGVWFLLLAAMNGPTAWLGFFWA